MALIIPQVPPYIYRWDIKIDGTPLEGPPGMREGEILEISLPSKASRAREAHRIFRLSPSHDYILLYASYNARSAPTIRKITGAEPIFAYGDSHGRRWAALFRATAAWEIDYDIPGHHGHYTTRRRIRGNRYTFGFFDHERIDEEAIQV